MQENKDKYYFAKRNNCLYQEELDYFYSFSDKERAEMFEEAKEQIKKLSEEQKNFVSLFGEDTIAIAFCPTYEDITDEAITQFYVERSKYQKEAEEFFKKKEAKEVYDFLDYVPELSTNGEYKITGENNALLQTIIKNGFFKNLDYWELKEIEKKLPLYWENKQEFLLPKKIDEISNLRNGLNFKEYVFCEEYLKTGRVKKTSEILGIGRTTCYDYLNKEEVKKYLEARRKEMQEESDLLFKQGFYDCFEELQKIVKEKHTDDNAKIKAIDIYLKHYENSLYKQMEQV